MLQIDMTAKVRSSFGKGANRSLRRAGQTPAVLYGPQCEPLALACDTKDLTMGLLSIHRQNAVINLAIDVDGKSSTRHVVTREIQTDPIMDSVLHADFYEISLDAPLSFDVPLKYVGKAKGVDMGGDMLITKNKIKLKGKALDIPNVIEIDVKPLGLGEAITCQDLPLPAGVTLEEDGRKVCVSVEGAAS